MQTLIQDLRYAVRQLRKSPGFTAVAVITLALGIGMNTAIFSVVNAVLLRPLRYPDPDRIVVFTTSSPDGSISAASPIKFNVWREQTTVFQDISAYRFGRVNMTGTDHPEQIQSAAVSGDYFRLFGQRIERGRSISPDEDRPNGGDVVVLSDVFCRRAFGGDLQTIGRTILLDGRPYEVIGVMTAGDQAESPSAFAPEPPDVWMPLQIDPNSNDESSYFNVAARLKPGVTLAMAAGQLKVTTLEFRRKFPGVEGMTPKSVFTVQPMKDALANTETSYLFVLSGAVSFVLFIACANVAGLLLVRATGRQREIAIRAAVGAGRGRIIRQLLTESVVLSTSGGVLGLVLGMVGIRALLALDTINIARIGVEGSAVTADWRVLFFTTFLSVTTGILFSLIPALQASHTDLRDALNATDRHSGTGFRQNKASSLLVVSEVTLALVLLAGAGLLVRTFIALRFVDPGFDPHDVLTMRIALTAQRFQKTSGVAELVRDSVQRITALPGVVATAFTCCLPLEDRTLGDVIIAGRPLDGRSHGTVNITAVSPSYFQVLKIPVIRGRGFTNGEDTGAPSVVVINEAMARRFWPKNDILGDPLKERLVFPELPNQAWQIIGVVGDVHADGLSQSSPPTIYFSVAQAPNGLIAYLGRSPMAWVVRIHGEPHSLSLAIQEELRRTSGGLPVESIRSMDEVLAQSTAGRKFNMLLLSIFGGSALLLAAIGIYGLMAYSVQQRTKEIGIRMALGAKSSDVRNMVLFQGLRLVFVGIAIGIPAALFLTRFIASFLFGVRAQDPAVFAAVPILLSAVTIFAVWLPARRAAKVDPMVALRYE